MFFVPHRTSLFILTKYTVVSLLFCSDIQNGQAEFIYCWSHTFFLISFDKVTGPGFILGTDKYYL